MRLDLVVIVNFVTQDMNIFCFLNSYFIKEFIITEIFLRVQSLLRGRQLISLAGSSRFEFSHSNKHGGNCLVVYDAVYFGMKLSLS